MEPVSELCSHLLIAQTQLSNLYAHWLVDVVNRRRIWAQEVFGRLYVEGCFDALAAAPQAANDPRAHNAPRH